MSNDRLILCGGSQAPPGASGEVVRLDMWGGRHNVNPKLITYRS